MNQSRERLESVQPLNVRPELTEEEQAAAVEAFEKLCIDTLGNCIDDVEQLDFGGDPRLPFAFLTMYIDAEDKSSLLIRLEDRNIDDDEHNSPFRVRLREMDEEGDIHMTCVYTLSRDYSMVTKHIIDDADESDIAQKIRNSYDEFGVRRDIYSFVNSMQELLSKKRGTSEESGTYETLEPIKNEVSLTEVERIAQLVSIATPYSERSN